MLARSVEVSEPIAFFRFQEHNGTIHKNFSVFSGHLVIKSAEELFNGIYGLTTDCQQEGQGVGYHLFVGGTIHFN